MLIVQGPTKNHCFLLLDIQLKKTRTEFSFFEGKKKKYEEAVEDCVINARDNCLMTFVE